MLSLALSRVSALCARRAVLVSLFLLLLTAAGVAAVVARLGVDTDTGNLFAASLPWKREQAAMARAFPQNEELLAIVVDSAVPEVAEATANSLAQILSFDRRNFTSVRQPDVSPWFDRNGLMFLDKGALATLLDQTVDAQPFLGQLAADPSLRGVAGALSLLAQGVTAGADLKPFAAPLRAFHDALSAAAAGHPAPLSWELLLSGPLSSLAGPYRFVLAKPVLDFGAIQPGARATAAVRDAAGRLPFVQDGSARVRITGSVALDDDEFSSVEQGVVGGLVGSLVLMTGWLYLALGTWRTIVPVLLTLLLGLVLTAAFAALAVGTLNLVSVAFAVLFVGLAVDFGIQFSARFREAELDVPETGAAGLVASVRLSTRRAGAQILVAAAATAAGFLAFTPTAFKGVAQLGLIAGVGMLIAFVCTLTALPAFLGLFRPRALGAEGGYAWAGPVDNWVVRWRRPILWASAGFAAVGASLLGQVPFDSDPLHTKNQSTESIRTLNDLAADPITNPYTIDVLAPSAAAAADLAPRLTALPTVDSVLTLDSLVPEDQAEKLPLIQDAASLLLPTLGAPPQQAPATPAEMRRAVESAAAAINDVAGKLPPGDPLLALAGDLRALVTVPDDRLAAASRAMVEFLPPTLDRLRVALTPVPVTRADVPPALARDWVAPDGQAKVQVLPKRDAMNNNAGLHRFVAEVSAVAPDAGGSAVTIVRSTDTIITAFRDAAAYAIAAIAVILILALRRLLDTLLVLAPLLLSSLLTVIVATVLPLELNFANIIALPLLLGVGVSFNVYFVMGWRAGRSRPLSSATARAVLFSALTTATAFGSLALSGHPGTASLGKLLLLSLGSTLLTTMLFVPALLAAIPRREEEAL